MIYPTKQRTMNPDFCCCCARSLSHIPPLYTDEKSEKPQFVPSDRSLPCCGRTICGNCIHGNQRFATYCPFCQISTGPSSLPQGLKDPPSYSEGKSNSGTSSPPRYEQAEREKEEDALPSYASISSNNNLTVNEKAPQHEQAEDVLHFIDHARDTMQSLSLRYGVPIDVLRRKNGVTADHLLLARRTVLIPGEWYKGGVSLSPRPVEGEEEERKKSIVRRFMVGCKVAELVDWSLEALHGDIRVIGYGMANMGAYRYDVAILYLEQANYDLEMAMDVYKDDERWEKEHPVPGNGKGKGKTRSDVGRRRFTGQRS
ncbi:thiamine biosynthetic bifunctional enzyme protein [Rutstroemia sp. NJR-2017a BVV2]|nr:thiamine biosynthetic bifunctional enzyme protein [Rutstroemia sp. NJR-2017a BVV2]